MKNDGLKVASNKHGLSAGHLLESGHLEDQKTDGRIIVRLVT